MKPLCFIFPHICTDPLGLCDSGDCGGGGVSDDSGGGDEGRGGGNGDDSGGDGA